MSSCYIILNLLYFIFILLYFKSVRSTNSTTSIDDFIWDRITNSDTDDPFYALDIQEVLRKFNDWIKYIPRVRPHYAVKCNPNPYVLELMSTLDIGFDCASKVSHNYK